ncbi:hypothetical protein [Streptomyces mangrovisoli]|uniref:Lipoprotein n=1 Tax=Streptomyces mangrovisoli TaxID=1428628 RepID=A0A1J4P4Y2_9ACTN|nr:hypothetical protein [Streptomyces mangrovisoli]OIJ69807.1 hypothetical protein WN71_001000 [Streptomyces mangrovisoli]
MRSSRRSTLARLATVAVTVTVAATGTACTAAQSDSRPRPAAVTSARLSTALPADPVRMVLPATGAESRWAQGLEVFVQQVQRAAEVSCARTRGFTLPATVPATFIRFSELPDLDFIARHGTSQSATVPQPSTSPAPTRTGTTAEVQACLTQGKAAATSLRDRYSEVQGQWFGTIATLRRDPATLRALRTLPGCFSRYGIEADSEQAYFALADKRMQEADVSELPAQEHELGQAYATCMRPVEAVREPARAKLRTGFLAKPEHADAVRALRTTLVPALRSAEKRYGVRLVFPAP